MTFCFSIRIIRLTQPEIVDISFEPDQCRSKMQESDETSCEFFIASENASLPLDFVDEAFDDVAFSVADSVIVPWLPVIAAGSGDRLYLWVKWAPKTGPRAKVYSGAIPPA